MRDEEESALSGAQVSEDAGNRKAVKRARTSTLPESDEDVVRHQLITSANTLTFWQEEDEAPARKRSSRAAGGNARVSSVQIATD